MPEKRAMPPLMAGHRRSLRLLLVVCAGLAAACAGHRGQSDGYIQRPSADAGAADVQTATLMDASPASFSGDDDVACLDDPECAYELLEHAPQGSALFANARAVLSAARHSPRASCACGGGGEDNPAFHLYHYVAPSLYADRVFLRQLLEQGEQDECPLQYAPPAFQNDDELLSTRAGVADCLSQAASKSIERRALAEKVLPLGAPLRVFSDAIRDDESLARMAIAHDALSLMDVSPRLADNAELVELAVTKDKLAIKYASPRLQRDRAFLLRALSGSHDEMPERFLRPFADDREVILAAARQRALPERMTKKWRKDVEVCLAASDYSNHCDASLLSLREVSLALVTRNPRAYLNLPSRMKRDEAIAALAVSQHGGTYARVPQALRGDKQLAARALCAKESPIYPTSLAAPLNEDEALATTWLQCASRSTSWYSYGRTSPLAQSMLANKAFVLQSIRALGRSFDPAWITTSSAWDEQTARELAKERPCGALKYAPPSLREDVNFATDVLRRCPVDLEDAPESILSNRVAMLQLAQDVAIDLKLVSSPLRGDIELVSAAIARRASNIAYANEDLWSSAPIVDSFRRARPLGMWAMKRELPVRLQSRCDILASAIAGESPSYLRAERDAAPAERDLPHEMVILALALIDDGKRPSEIRSALCANH